MRFKEMPVNTVFAFASETDPAMRFSGIERGPWIKLTARTYTKHTNPFSVDIHERQLHEQWHGLTCEVGSINVEVNPA